MLPSWSCAPASAVASVWRLSPPLTVAVVLNPAVQNDGPLATARGDRFENVTDLVASTIAGYLLLNDIGNPLVAERAAAE